MIVAMAVLETDGLERAREQTLALVETLGTTISNVCTRG